MAAELTTTDRLLRSSTRTLRALRNRMMPMTLLWLGFGILVGVLSAPADGGMVGVVAFAVAGMIVLPFMGAFLGLIGGKCRETLLGGVTGLVLGASVGLVTGQPEFLSVANVGLVGGALIGATFFSFVSHFRKGFAALNQ